MVKGQRVLGDVLSSIDNLPLTVATLLARPDPIPKHGNPRPCQVVIADMPVAAGARVVVHHETPLERSRWTWA
ncbi:MAG: hypothetical protein R3E42_16115 [Burkholderiaceae bacterium]